MGRKEDTATVRQRIIEASIRLFLAKGFAGGSVTELAQAVGIAKGTVYCHFKSKDEILESILDRFSTEFLDTVIREVDNCKGDFLARLRAFYKYTTEFGQNQRDLMLVWHTLLGEIIGSRSEQEKKMKAIQDRYNAFLEAFLEEGKRQGLIGAVDSRIHSRIITAILTGMLLQWYVESPSAEDSRQYARAFRDVILRGLGAADSQSGTTPKKRGPGTRNGDGKTRPPGPRGPVRNAMPVGHRGKGPAGDPPATS